MAEKELEEAPKEVPFTAAKRRALIAAADFLSVTCGPVWNCSKVKCPFYRRYKTGRHCAIDGGEPGEWPVRKKKRKKC